MLKGHLTVLSFFSKVKSWNRNSCVFFPLLKLLLFLKIDINTEMNILFHGAFSHQGIVLISNGQTTGIRSALVRNFRHPSFPRKFHQFNVLKSWLRYVYLRQLQPIQRDFVHNQTVVGHRLRNRSSSCRKWKILRSPFLSNG